MIIQHNILALDLGTTTGWAIQDNQKLISSGTISFKNSRFEGGGMRYLRFARFLEELNSDKIFSQIYFEEVRRHMGVDAAHAYGGFLAHLTAWCEKNNIPYAGVPVGTIKKHATGKGNDQVRFELGAYALQPGIQVIAPWREWDLTSRDTLMKYAEDNNIPIEMKRGKRSPYSMDANLLHISYEGDILEDPWAEPEEDMWRWSVSPENAPDTPTYIELDYKLGDIVGIDGQSMSPARVLEHLNKVGGANGIGRLDIVENRYVGMKARGCYETPGGTIMLKAHRAIESITLDREAAHLKDDLMPRYSRLIYNGYWWSPERLALQALIDETQKHVNGQVRLKLYRGNVTVVGRQSESDSLFDPEIATFEDDAGAYNQKDAEGFIKLNALRLRVAAKKNAGLK